MLTRARHELLKAYDAVKAEIPPVKLDAVRHAFLERYPPEALANLAGDDLLRFVHGAGPKQGLFYELEFGEVGDPFGSIAGGSALKYKVYRAQDGSGWRKKGKGNPPLPCTEAEALQITTDIVASLHRTLVLADKLDLASGDRARWAEFEKRVSDDNPASLSGQGQGSAIPLMGWAHKYMALARPDLFSFHHQPRTLAIHLIRLGEKPAQDAGRYLMDWHWRNLRLSGSDMKDRESVLLTAAAYRAFGYGNDYWRVGTDESTVQGFIDRWPAMRDGGFASVGWGELGDLRLLLPAEGAIEAKNRLKDILSKQYPEKTPQTIGKWASQIYDFINNLNKGDRIVAMKGYKLQGVGTITGDYEFVAGDQLQPHHRRVEWRDIQPQEWPGAPGFRTTVYRFTEKYADAAQVEELLDGTELLPVIHPVIDGGVPKPFPDPAPQQDMPLLPVEQRIRDILNRKGQVILYGPPGTGKTYNARQAARELIARERCGGHAWAMLGEDQKREVDAAIEFVTFHPAYAYEDFIEGYRPATAAEGAMPSFELRDGVFVEACEKARRESDGRHRILLIDEINRGNVAAVLGELISLLENDKRDHLTAKLPLSRREFTVPGNLWIIGTMNTADRSISLLDTALRRRFGFVELLPEPERLAASIDGLSLAALLSEVNARVRKSVTRNARDLQVGHAYLMRNGAPITSKEELLVAFRDDIIPLLAEYCFENYNMLAALLGDEIIDKEQQTPSADLMEDAALFHKALRKLVSADPVRTTDLGSDEGDEETEAPDDSAEETPEEDGVGDDGAVSPGGTVPMSGE